MTAVGELDAAAEPLTAQAEPSTAPARCVPSSLFGFLASEAFFAYMHPEAAASSWPDPTAEVVPTPQHPVSSGPATTDEHLITPTPAARRPTQQRRR
ncbi:hypothetical protein CC85DRAFT_284271 [Cutaneotrichosporon oleaginosum]|uniref:Uncharacterized protein n=1 Tax=Cutaneotrichosporon oleaginosum TaxID=879819 RepID=A0A0J0XRP6_9TREE|nr:uncharacterized protein CC85DRAFT_284271 [Cutaneotrichosporon oleaginosum]KLT43763.1 hypothetical protein CC85DRAFT_284271 [Cutaneotrichosporon oleaginosum]TXT05180.1 hypothetical protein COLE_06500 [Cutaneotrichosporon oleaginosum]